MSRYRNFGSQTSFLDLLFNSLLAFVGFFMLAIMLIQEENEYIPSSLPKVEFMLTFTWPSGNNDDVDAWIVDPLDSIVYFNRREDGLMHLDRDDVGNKNDIITLPNGKKFEYKENREVINLRGYVPGEYLVNVHMFVKRDPGVTPVQVKLEKMNPYKVCSVKDITLTEGGQELTVMRFKIDKTGEIVSITDGPPRNLIKTKGK